MKLNKSTLGTLAASALASALLTVGAAAYAAAPPAQDAHAQEHSAAATHEHAASAHELKLNDGKKWETDAPLRQGVSKMKAAVEAQLPALRSGNMNATQYEALAGEVETQIAYMVENCKLDPEPDDVLHVLLAQAAEGSEALKGNGAGPRDAGVAKVVESLQQYGEYFDHPGWKAPALHKL